jgi:hypothetical protein
MHVLVAIISCANGANALAYGIMPTPNVSMRDRSFLQEAPMAETEKEAYLALIAARDPEIRALLDQGFEFVTNAFKADAAPSGMKSRTDREHVRRLQQAGYQVEVSAAYDEQGNPRPTLSAIWRKKP